MVDVMPSSNMDDLPGTPLPSDAPARQYLTRRELREAEARAAATVSAISVAPVSVTPVVVASAPRSSVSGASVSGLTVSGSSVSSTFPDFMAAGIQMSVAPIQDAPSARNRPSGAESRKLRRADVRRMHAAVPKGTRKHPVSVLATMVVVGGLFAVAGLPAYALTNTETGGAKVDAAAQSITVSGQSAPVAAIRDTYEATSPEEIAEATKDDVRAGNNARYLASGARELGDDYPWPYELGEEQGGGLSVLNYYYRQCTDFVAWRINRDAGSFKAPFKWVWSNMTPTGGNASQWKYAWEQHGWPVSNTPTVGDVAWFGSINHVAYVKQVLDGGFVVIEEYNYVQSVYGQRTIPVSQVEAFLGKPS